MRIFQINAPDNQENNLDADEPKVLFGGTMGKQVSTGQANLRNVSESEEPPEDLDDPGVLTYIKRLTTYLLDLADTLLGFTRDPKASALVLGKDLDRLCIQTEAAHGRLGQDKDTEQEHGTVWGAILNAV